MNTVRALVAAVLLSACATRPPAPDSTRVAEIPRASEVGPAQESLGGNRCRRLDRKQLQQSQRAEGSVLFVVSVAKARGQQIDQLNRQLAYIAAALAKGCLE